MRLTYVFSLLLGMFSALELIAAEKEQYLRFNLAVMENGDCFLKVENTDRPMESATKFEGQPVSFKRFSGYECLKNSKGTHRLVHSFATDEKLSSVFPISDSAEIDKFTGALLLKALPEKPATATYWCRARLPLIICYDRVKIPTSSGVVTKLSSSKLGTLGVNLMSDEESRPKISIFWLDAGTDASTRQRTQILDPTALEPADGFTKKFRLPLPNLAIDDTFSIAFDARSNNQSKVSQIPRLLIQARLSPMFGIGLQEKSEVVFVHNLVGASIGEASGVKVGDVVREIDSEKVEKVADALSKLGSTELGQKRTFKIQRGTEIVDITMTAE
jgi:hypothetical protein